MRLHLDPEVSNRAFQLGVPEQQLNSSNVRGSFVDQSRLCAPERVTEQTTIVPGRTLITHGG
jgi:hypothetical protein